MRPSGAHRVPAFTVAEAVATSADTQENRPGSLVFKWPGAATLCAHSQPDWLVQLNNPTRGTTIYEGERGLHALSKCLLSFGVGERDLGVSITIDQSLHDQGVNRTPQIEGLQKG
jgi:hypothetical protein